MSLVERALGKMRQSTATPDAGATSVSRPVLQPPASRMAAEPQLRLTPQILSGLGLMAPPEQEYQRASEYRHIKRRVVAEIRDDPANRVVLVTSALAGEGKSFTAANLARSLALEPDYTVLLVDADTIKPQVSRALGMMDRVGLMNALADETCDPEALVVTTDIEGLSVLPTGSISEHADEYFASARMRRVLERLLAVPNRIVIIDSLPLLLTTEARALLPLAAQLLLVVRAESTPRAAVGQALALVGEEANVKLVLNAVVRTPMSRYLGYGYGFEYDYAARKKESTPS